MPLLGFAVWADTSRETKLALTIAGEAALRAVKRMAGVLDGAGSRQLTTREKQVLRWVAAGRRHIDIAQTLGSSERTEENHLRRIRARLGAKTTAEAVRIAFQNGDVEN